MKNRTRSPAQRTVALLFQKWSPTGAVRSLMAVALVGSVVAGCDTHSPTGPGAVTNITVTPDVTLAINGTQQFTAVGTDADGNVVTFTPEWSVAGSGGSITQSGMFTAGTELGVFSATVMASYGALSGTATVTVIAGPLDRLDVIPDPDTLAINETQQFTALGWDAGGNPVPVRPTWGVVNGGGSIDTGSGSFTAGTAAGTFDNTVQASSDGITATATVQVVAGALAVIEVTPDPATLAINETQPFTAVGRDAGGNPVAISPTWDVVNGGGTIDAGSGLFTAGTVTGTFNNTVRATRDGISGTATVTVVAGSLQTITVTPNPATVETLSTQQFTATGRDAGGNLVAISPAWDVVNGGGSIDSGSGLFTAGTVTGTFDNTVEAASGGITASATVEVVAPGGGAAAFLGAAAPNGIMAGTEVTCVTGGLVSADVSIHPGSTITGFGPCVITGTQNLANAVAEQAQIDLTTAYNTLAGLPCPPANAIVADLGGTTKPAGVYCTASGINVTGALTLDGGGDPDATFVFQAGTSLTTAGNIVLINGAQAKNVYWQVGSSATLGTASQWQGNVLALSSISLVDNATLLGRALARNGAVTLGTNNVITLP